MSYYNAHLRIDFHVLNILHFVGDAVMELQYVSVVLQSSTPIKAPLGRVG